MGYSSDVALSFNYKYVTEEVLEVLIRLHDEIFYEEEDNEIYLLFIIEGVKWNTENECGIIIAWYKDLDDKDFYFVEIGEDLADNTNEGCLEIFNLNISRSICHSGETYFDKDLNEDSIKIDLSIPCKETIFKKIKDIHVRCTEKQSE